MKPGELVRRGKLWSDWIKQNQWMEEKMMTEIGMVIKMDDPDPEKFQTFAVVLWADGVHSWEDPHDLEIIKDETG